MNKLKICNSYKQEIELVESYIKKLLDEKSELTILEAGCGRRWPFQLDATKCKYRIVGVDLDKKALESRTKQIKDLDVGIEGDLRYLDLGKHRFDVIYSSFVLEHIDNAKLVLGNFLIWLKPEGLLILRIPDRNSVYGFFTRLTPLWFHAVYRKYFLGIKDAGQSGFGPYPTYYNKILSREGIREYCKTHRLLIDEEFGSDHYLRRKGIRTLLIKVFVVIVSRLSFGRLMWDHNNLTYVLRK